MAILQVVSWLGGLMLALGVVVGSSYWIMSRRREDKQVGNVPQH